jgi:multidrug efflux pump subunit AcrB
MVRYPLSERRSLSDIENMRIRLPGGQEIPFSTVAGVTYGRGYADIQRAERRRVVNVTADVDAAVANASDINANLWQKVLPELETRYPGLQYRFAGEQRERQESFGTLYVAFPLVLVALYGLLAVQFRSYVQSLVVMSVVPFGIVGAVFGHVVMGYDLGLMSFCGIVALSGIVVDNSVILIDAINRERRDGIPVWQTVRDTTARRFRPIVLTSLTTSLGVLPLILERSLQARFMIPMAISLGFGVAFATMITLLLVPSLYMMVEDVRNLVLKMCRRVEGAVAVPTDTPGPAGE